MNETMMTVCGNLVDAPRLRLTKNGHTLVSFRLASTQRRFDREQGEWIDGDTLFLTVTAWRGFAENIARSLHKGQPVVVRGRYYQRDYIKDEMPRTLYELEAVAVGHDLSRGIASFERVTRSSTPSVPTDATGAPEDLTDEYFDAVAEDDEVPEGVDPGTGEVRELAPA